MFDPTLLVGLPPAEAIDTDGLTPAEAAVTLRQAARLRLSGAQQWLSQRPQDQAQVIALLDEAAVLFDRAVMRLTVGVPAAVASEGEADLAPADTPIDPGLGAVWGQDFGPLIWAGMRRAETWLEDAHLPLWWVLIQDRRLQPPGEGQDAFEAGFLLRLQQALTASRPNAKPGSSEGKR